jgi:hypothetical protein
MLMSVTAGILSVMESQAKILYIRVRTNGVLICARETEVLTLRGVSKEDEKDTRNTRS